jgi:hypothetical protein
MQGLQGSYVALSRNYFARQAASLLALAKQIRDPETSAALIEKATDLNEKLQELPPKPDASPRPPDVESGS